ncbi:LAMI_0E08064g1_1 [Lachancea mirantina]|uniref:Elongator complex protein 4 n=1 Tax=Lachancea mirantina TaxID=1230905 RepID=A0A1G4JNB7_9SACH|nr:LAMI_0E08064g1_1 [Lachancea mirantina]
MSFRKRGDVITQLHNDRNPEQRFSRTEITNVRGTKSIRTPGGISAGTRGVNPTLAKLKASRNSSGITEVIAGLEQVSIDESDSRTTQQSNFHGSHPGLRPSPATSLPTTSTGSADLDKILRHMGLPLGQSLLIEEQTTTDFSSVLAKVFVAQGIVHNRVDGGGTQGAGNTHVVVVSPNQAFGKQLPGVYHGSTKDIKRSKISEQESKVTVQNMLQQQQQQGQRTTSKDLKIAWRYGLNDQRHKSGSGKRTESDLETYPRYNNAFDITSRLVPAPTSAEITFISPIQPLRSFLSQLEAVLKKHPCKVVRILMPNLLHPAIYPTRFAKLSEIIRLLHGVRSLVKTYSMQTAMVATFSCDLYSSNRLFKATIENLFDAIINLEPFPQEMLQFLERAYKTQPNRVQHGLLHIERLPHLSEYGEMHIARSEWAFKNGKKKFEIEPWGIPVDDSEVDESKSSVAGSEPHEHQTTKNLEF